MSRIANSHFTASQAYYRNCVLEAYARRDKLSLEAKRAHYRRMFPSPPAAVTSGARSLKVTEGLRQRRSHRLPSVDPRHKQPSRLRHPAVPKQRKSGERLPPVFTQHGFGGIPEHALGVDDNFKADAVYRKSGLTLARRGYAVFSPMISTQAQADRLAVNRLANPRGMTPPGVEAWKATRLIEFLETLPFIDKNRVGYYGLSYGGYSALWITPGEPRFKAVVVRGHFNDWSIKTTDLTMGRSYMFYDEPLDMYNFGVLQHLSHSDLGRLIAPRPLLIEMGDIDGVMVAPRRAVDTEIDVVANHDKAVGHADGFSVAPFNGPHRIDGAESYAFLDRWLK